eukprot:TRINITY_DN25481_c0_g1_i2.p1 TRINITY_DN25481_c0_g1~~TRINITY_DN25481_c0_g1_i2.p1  ORF type:complete len:612 (-),score=74.55 TRINITY_DN25481_c0_g1_i2:114-1949(-)
MEAMCSPRLEARRQAHLLAMQVPPKLRSCSRESGSLPRDWTAGKLMASARLATGGGFADGSPICTPTSRTAAQASCHANKSPTCILGNSPSAPSLLPGGAGGIVGSPSARSPLLRVRFGSEDFDDNCCCPTRELAALLPQGLPPGAWADVVAASSTSTKNAKLRDPIASDTSNPCKSPKDGAATKSGGGGLCGSGCGGGGSIKTPVRRSGNSVPIGFSARCYRPLAITPLLSPRVSPRVSPRCSPRGSPRMQPTAKSPRVSLGSNCSHRQDSCAGFGGECIIDTISSPVTPAGTPISALVRESGESLGGSSCGGRSPSERSVEIRGASFVNRSLAADIQSVFTNGGGSGYVSTGTEHGSFAATAAAVAMEMAVNAAAEAVGTPQRQRSLGAPPKRCASGGAAVASRGAAWPSGGGASPSGGSVVDSVVRRHSDGSIGRRGGSETEPQFAPPRRGQLFYKPGVPAKPRSSFGGREAEALLCGKQLDIGAAKGSIGASARNAGRSRSGSDCAVRRGVVGTCGDRCVEALGLGCSSSSSHLAMVEAIDAFARWLSVARRTSDESQDTPTEIRDALDRLSRVVAAQTAATCSTTLTTDEIASVIWQLITEDAAKH